MSEQEDNGEFQRHDILKAYKDEGATLDKIVVGAPLLRDWELCALLLVWPNVRCMWPDGETLELGGNADLWEALWDGCAIDYDQVCTLLRVDMQAAIETCTRAQGLKLIYPDGNVHAGAFVIAREIIASHMPEKVVDVHDEDKDPPE